MRTVTCKQCAVEFTVTDEDVAFYKKISPTFSGQIFEIPTPTLCYECRLQRRLAFRNERNLFSRSCNKSGAQIVAAYPKESPYRVYSQVEWWKDDWDAMEFGQEYDPARPFFEQVRELRKKVPRIALISVNSENSEYTNQAAKNKDCYMSFDIGWCENVLHSRTIYSAKDVVDSFNCRDNCESLYECINCQNASNSRFCYSCSNISGCYYCFDLRGCRDCILSSNQQNKQYLIENKQYSKEEYEKIKSEMGLDSFTASEELKKKYSDLIQSSIHKFAENTKCESCTGNNLSNCSNLHTSFGANRSEDGKFFFYSERIKDSYDDNYGGGESDCELNLETIGCYMLYNSKFLFSCWTVNDSLYCDFCHTIKDCFGCVGLRQKQFCILNKQYTQEEYTKKVAEIIENMKQSGEWGEYFPIEHSPFPYNFTLANDYFPLSREAILAKGYAWGDKQTTLVSSTDYRIPDAIAQVKEDILDTVLSCQVSGRPYKIQPQEYVFYVQQGIPIPRTHPDQRYAERFSMLNPLRLWSRVCMCSGSCSQHPSQCENTFDTSYAPERIEKVFCERCYLGVVG